MSPKIQKDKNGKRYFEIGKRKVFLKNLTNAEAKKYYNVLMKMRAKKKAKKKAKKNAKKPLKGKDKASSDGKSFDDLSRQQLLQLIQNRGQMSWASQGPSQPKLQDHRDSDFKAALQEHRIENRLKDMGDIPDALDNLQNNLDEQALNIDQARRTAANQIKSLQADRYVVADAVEDAPAESSIDSLTTEQILAIARANAPTATPIKRIRVRHTPHTYETGDMSVTTIPPLRRSSFSYDNPYDDDSKRSEPTPKKQFKVTRSEHPPIDSITADQMLEDTPLAPRVPEEESKRSDPAPASASVSVPEEESAFDVGTLEDESPWLGSAPAKAAAAAPAALTRLKKADIIGQIKDRILKFSIEKENERRAELKEIVKAEKDPKKKKILNSTAFKVKNIQKDVLGKIIAGIPNIIAEVAGPYAGSFDPSMIASMSGYGKVKYLSRAPVAKRGLYDDQLNQIMSKYPDYLGTVAVDEIKTLLPKIQPQSRIAFIFNTDKASGKGVHWIAVYADAREGGSNSIEYVDSFASDPSPSVLKDLQLISQMLKSKNYLKLKVNKVVQQFDDTETCGWHCARFLIDRFRGKTFAEATGFNPDKKIHGHEEVAEARAEKMAQHFNYV